jgi:ABC-type amino acid transport system permease subunit
LYVNIFRGVPALVTGLWVFFGLSLVLGINFSVFQSGVITLSLLYSAFICEDYRAALEAVPPGHREAGYALGMRSFRVFASVTLPQATKIALPNIGSMYIGMVKDTSTLTLIGLTEVVRTTQNIVSLNYQYFALYSAAALLYVMAAFVIDLVFRVLESSYTAPPRGTIARLLRSRKRKRIERVVSQVASALVRPEDAGPPRISQDQPQDGRRLRRHVLIPHPYVVPSSREVMPCSRTTSTSYSDVAHCRLPVSRPSRCWPPAVARLPRPARPVRHRRPPAAAPPPRPQQAS